jgi:hypothetical protein
MKIALIKENSRKKQHHLKISSIRNEEDLSHQNRGESSKFRREMARDIKIFHQLRQQTTKENEAKSTRI